VWIISLQFFVLVQVLSSVTENVAVLLALLMTEWLALPYLCIFVNVVIWDAVLHTVGWLLQMYIV